VPLIFTKRLKRESGYIEWPVLQKLLANQPVDPSDTDNELLRLRLSPLRSTIHDSTSIIYDLLRALTPWPGVWSTVPTRKGELRISLVYDLRSTTCLAARRVYDPQILIAGKPKPISLADFTKYYL
jgi:methionyl-tRNA formyltransferase